MSKYELSDQARDDLTDIFEYNAADNEPAALVVIVRLLDLFQKLVEQPRMGRSRDDIQERLRSIAQGNYLAFYRIWAGQVVIVRVLDAARDLDEIFS